MKPHLPPLPPPPKVSVGDFVEFFQDGDLLTGIVARRNVVSLCGRDSILVEAFCDELQRVKSIHSLLVFEAALQEKDLRVIDADRNFYDIGGETMSVRDIYEAVKNR